MARVIFWGATHFKMGFPYFKIAALNFKMGERAYIYFFTLYLKFGIICMERDNRKGEWYVWRTENL